MARPIDRDKMLLLAKLGGGYTPHSLVHYHDVDYVIWKDKNGPVYSTVAEYPERKLAASRNTVYWSDAFDTVTNRIVVNMHGTEN